MSFIKTTGPEKVQFKTKFEVSVFPKIRSKSCIGEFFSTLSNHGQEGLPKGKGEINRFVKTLLERNPPRFVAQSDLRTFRNRKERHCPCKGGKVSLLLNNEHLLF